MQLVQDLNLIQALYVLVAQSCSTLQFHGLEPTRLPCPWNSPGTNTGEGCHFLLQEMFLTQGLSQETRPGSPALQADS